MRHLRARVSYMEIDGPHLNPRSRIVKDFSDDGTWCHWVEEEEFLSDKGGRVDTREHLVYVPLRQVFKVTVL